MSTAGLYTEWPISLSLLATGYWIQKCLERMISYGQLILIFLRCPGIEWFEDAILDGTFPSLVQPQTKNH
jgi:hypothetical protein